MGASDSQVLLHARYTSELGVLDNVRPARPHCDFASALHPLFPGALGRRSLCYRARHGTIVSNWRYHLLDPDVSRDIAWVRKDGRGATREQSKPEELVDGAEGST
jgi:hypothetical protein